MGHQVWGREVELKRVMLERVGVPGSWVVVRP